MPLTIRKRGKTGRYQVRGTVPAKTANGSIGHIRIEESTGTSDSRKARKVAADIERHYHELAYNPQASLGPTFAEATLLYIQTTGNKDIHVKQLLDHFGETPLKDIDQAAALRAADVICPGTKASTRNRRIFTPLIAISRLSGVTLPLKRPKGYAAITPRAIPDDEWFEKVLAVASPQIGALILFLTLTGRRIGEAIALRKDDIDYETRTAQIRKTKTGKPISVRVPDICFDKLGLGSDVWASLDGQSRLFRFRSSGVFRKQLAAACRKHGLTYFPSHALGRHSFATRLLREGKSIKFVQEAGHWATPTLVMSTYGHLEKQQVHSEASDIGTQWLKKQVTVGAKLND